jgi:hypothetical protein
MRNKLVRLMAVVAAVGLAACGETDLEMAELTEAEAQALAGLVLMATFSNTGDVPTQPSAVAGGPQAVPFEFSNTFEGDFPCPLGGAVAVTAEFDASGDTQSEAGRIEYSMTQVHDDCGVMSEEHGQFNLFGAPSLTLDFVVENNGQGVTEWGGSVTGAVEWVNEGRTGTCTVALEFSGRQEGADALDALFGGAVCGFHVQQELSIG